MCDPQQDARQPGRGLQDAWQMLELAAIHHPDTLAVVDCARGGRLLTYQALFERSAALACAMRARGVRRGDRVGVLCRNSAAVLELHFAAAAIHAVVVNLNIHLAPPELAYILDDSAPVVVFADRHYAQTLREALAAAGGAPRRVVWIDVEVPESGTPAVPSGAQVDGLQASQAAPPCGNAP
jgi:acyl-CoA synthetase (AMP-forming)/AMP-acid ligase II